jgi:class 3 adenylate cyclase
MAGEVLYAQGSGAQIAYECLGSGPRDILVLMEGVISIDAMDDEPRLAHSMARLNSWGRLIRFDRRGVGLSDPVAPNSPPTLEQWVDDAIAVLDAVGSERAVILASDGPSPVGLLLAATRPDRVESLVVVNAYARLYWDVDYPAGFPLGFSQIDEITAVSTPQAENRWVYTVVPSAAHDPVFRQWWDRTGRRGASPSTAKALLRVVAESDVRAVLPTIQSPTLVIHLRDVQPIPLPLGRYVADHVPHARWVELPGADGFWWFSDSAALVLDHVEEFVTGGHFTPLTNRLLSTILFTDIVSSTEHVSAMGDARWHEVLDRFDGAVRRQLERFRGVEVNTTGDGFVATFDGPARAVGCACAIRDSARQLGLEVRSGVHTGEIELRGNDIAGIGVHIAARVAALAKPSSVWVSRTVTDLVVGSGIRFEAIGDHELKGVPGMWTLCAVAEEGHAQL